MARMFTPEMRLKEGDDMFSLRVPYNPLFTEELKEEIPWAGRMWDKKEKVWRIHVDFAGQVKDIVRKRFGSVLMDGSLKQHLDRKNEEFPHEE